MGGVFSGKRGRRAGAKQITDDFRRVDVRELYRQGVLKPGGAAIICWGIDGRGQLSARSLATAEGLVLICAARPLGGAWQEMAPPLRLTWTACTYGGARPWFRCPGPRCGRRAALLYGDVEFRCRHCLELAYPSQRADRKLRALRRAQGIRVRLGGAPDSLCPVPRKPHGMHCKTYNRLVVELLELEGAALGELGDRVGLLSGHARRFITLHRGALTGANHSGVPGNETVRKT